MKFSIFNFSAKSACPSEAGRRRGSTSGGQFLILGRNGQSTLEIIIALAVLTAAITSATLVMFSGQSLSLDARFSNQALRIARSEIEKMEAQARYNFNSITSTSSVVGEFTKNVVVGEASTSTKRVIAEVSWRTDQQRVQKVELATLVTDWRGEQASGGDSGGGGLVGAWCNPTTLGSVDLGPGNEATDLDVKNKIVYMSAAASAENKPDFFIVNAANPQSPTVISSINTGPSLNSLDIAGNYAYLANSSSSAQLQVVDVSDINSPALIFSFQLPGVSGSGAVGNAIFFYNRRIYMGTKKTTGPEFHIVDVTNPLNPLALGSYEFNDTVGAIYVRNDFAYVATANTAEMTILNVSDPNSISVAGTFDANGSSEDGKAIWLVGNTIYLGRTVGGNHADHHEFYIIDVSSSTAPQTLGSKDLAVNLNDIIVKGSYAFMATDDPNKEFQVWDISNPSNLISCTNFNFPQTATGIDYEDNLVYVSVRSNNALRIITSQ